MKNAKTTTSAPAPTNPEQRRVLGLFSIVGIVVGTMIGSGIFINPANIAKTVETPKLMLAVRIAADVKEAAVGPVGASVITRRGDIT